MIAGAPWRCSAIWRCNDTRPVSIDFPIHATRGPRIVAVGSEMLTPFRARYEFARHHGAPECSSGATCA